MHRKVIYLSKDTLTFQLNSLKINPSAGWCYYGGCHRKTSIFQKACPSMADSVGWNNMSVLGDKSCDKWHERLWGRRYYCCTNDCQYQKCGKTCSRLGMKDAEENRMQPKPCTFEANGDWYDGIQYFCCRK